MLEGKAVSLRELELEDLKQLFRWHDENEIYLFRGRYKFISYDELKETFMDYTFSQQIFAIEQSHKLIGVCSYWGVDRRNRHCELYGEIYEKFKDTKIFLAESLKLLISFLFDYQNLFRVYAYLNEGNRDTRSVLEELGFTFEGTLREHKFYNGCYANSLVYSQLKAEYESNPGSIENGPVIS
jgi:ribosomal-protein-alanine N-acetyltransferase